MAITPGRASSTLQSLTDTSTWDVLFDVTLGSPAMGPALAAVEVFADTQDVLVRVTGVHSRSDGSFDPFLIAAGESQPFGMLAYRGITKVEAKPVVAGAKVKWTASVA